MIRRLLSISALFVLLGVTFASIPAGAQEATTTTTSGASSPLQEAINPLAEGLADLKEGLAPLEGPLGEAVAGILEGIDPLLTQLQGIIAQGAAACDALGPVLEGLQPLTSELQTLLDVDVSGLPIVGVLQPVVDTVNDLINQVLTLCAAEVTTTTAATTPPTAPPEQLPVTGGRAGLAVPGALVLGAAGLLVAARRRLSAG